MGKKNHKQHKKFYCYQCFFGYYNENDRDEHYAKCTDENPPQIRKYPPQGKTVKFRNHLARFAKPIIGVADFESCLQYQKNEQCKIRLKVPLTSLFELL